MKTLTLFRHAKSDWKDSPVLPDFDRPLAKRGEKAAPEMGEAIRAMGIRPDLILCSPSLRTRQTLDLAKVRAWDNLPEVRYDERLYHTPAPVLMEVLRALPSTVDHAMIVGHNPGLQALAIDLMRTGPKHAVRALEAKFPTAGLASLRLDIRGWPELRAGVGELLFFTTPKLRRAAA